MKKSLQAAVLAMCLSMVIGCAEQLPPNYIKPEPLTPQSTTTTRLQQASAQSLSNLANDTAYLISKLYSPDELVLSMNIVEEDVFGERLKKSLIAKGFIVYTDVEKTYRTTDLVYRLKSRLLADDPNGCYLQITMTNGFKLCQAYKVDPRDGFVLVPNHNNPQIPHSLKNVPDVNALLQKWSVKPGSLEMQLESWCQKAGYALIWQIDKDYIMPVHTQFQGTFVRAVQNLFAQMNGNGISIDANIYRGNKVLEVRQN